MQTLYATQLEIDHGDLSTEDTVIELTARIQSWVRAKYERQRPRWGEATLEFPDDGRVVHPLPGHELTGRMQQGDEALLSSLSWRHPDDGDPSIQWVAQVSIARLDGELQFHCVVGVESPSLLLRPNRSQVGRPAIVTEILDAYPTRIDGWPVPREVRVLDREAIPGFVTEVLLSPTRRLPVVVISSDLWSGRPCVDPESVRRILDGSAEVCHLVDKFAAFDLTNEVGKGLACYDGAARVYWPGMSLHDPSRLHPYYLSSVLRRFRERAMSWEKMLAQKLAGISATALSQSSLLQRVRRELIEERDAGARRKLEEATTGRVTMEDLLRELESCMGRSDELQAENDSLQARIEQLEYILRDWRPLAPESEEEEANGPPLGFATVEDAVEAARERLSGPLLFLDSALESASDSPFGRPDDVYSLLEALHAVSLRWKEQDGSLGTTWDNALAEKGYEYKPRIGDTTKGKWGETYRFHYKGEKRLFEAHVTIGSKSAERCLSVHFLRDDDDLVLVIGHVGRHLRNTKT